jgi:hypothetical protein
VNYKYIIIAICTSLYNQDGVRATDWDITLTGMPYQKASPEQQKNMRNVVYKMKAQDRYGKKVPTQKDITDIEILNKSSDNITINLAQDNQPLFESTSPLAPGETFEYPGKTYWFPVLRKPVVITITSGTGYSDFKFPASSKLYLAFDKTGMLRAQTGSFKGFLGRTKSGKNTKENIRVNLELWNNTKEPVFVSVANDQSNITEPTLLKPGRDYVLRDTIDVQNDLTTINVRSSINAIGIHYTIAKMAPDRTVFLVWKKGKDRKLHLFPQTNIVGGKFGLSRSGYSLGNNIKEKELQEKRSSGEFDEKQGELFGDL